MVPLARRNLPADKGRFAMSLGGVASAVLLILIVVSLYRGWSGFGRLYLDLPGDTWVVQMGTSDPFHASSSLPADRTRVLARLPGVLGVAPVYARHVELRTAGKELDVFFMALAIPPSAPVDSGVRRRYLPDQGHVSIDAVLANELGLDVGSKLRSSPTTS